VLEYVWLRTARVHRAIGENHDAISISFSGSVLYAIGECVLGLGGLSDWWIVHHHRGAAELSRGGPDEASAGGRSRARRARGGELPLRLRMGRIAMPIFPIPAYLPMVFPLLFGLIGLIIRLLGDDPYVPPDNGQTEYLE
jgi:hypothetical protein